MGTNTNEYQKKYMKAYVQRSPTITCPICSGEHKLVYRYHHNKSKVHRSILNFVNNFYKL